MHVIVVRHGDDAVVALGRQQNLVGDRAAERADAPPAQIGERAKVSGVGVADAQDFAELVVRKRDGIAGPPRGRVFDAAQADVRVAAGNRLIDRCKGDLDEARLAAKALRDKLGDLDVEADDARWVGGIGFDVRRAAFGVARPSEDGGDCAKSVAAPAEANSATVATSRNIERPIYKVRTPRSDKGPTRSRMA